jgi:tellurite methyltransferase
MNVKQLSADLAPNNAASNFTVATAEQLPYPDNTFDLAICSAIFHFAKSNEHFDAMLKSVWRVIKPGGYLFARLASDIGIEDLVIPVGDGVYHLPDGSMRYLMNQEKLLQYTDELGAELFEPIKTTNVQNLRCMTTWCLRKIS